MSTDGGGAPGPTPGGDALGAYTLSTDPARQDLDVICELLAASYWAAGRPREVIRSSLENSLVFGLFHGDRQVGLARVVTDYATFAWVCDVAIAEGHRGQGLGKWLMRTVLEHPDLNTVRSWMLATRDAHGLYTRFGFSPLEDPARWMRRLVDDP